MTVTVREQVCAVLLKGESVIATEFAKVAGCTGGAVADVLCRLQALSLVKAKKIKRGKFYLKVWTATDLPALAAYRPLRPGQHVRSGIDITPLLEVWGMPLKAPKLQLPATRHVCYDEPEEATA
ncbi:hypothetical protein BJN34_12865 [Cupriavidus necator]|uniref:Uncharacterized protein n=1 Tax=Cupriavidus necator TaxID=106590 RepID=A0A1U9UQ30_CUPNE|nr:hypothetical protein [Cupriavidus necator]AQV94772.1 hypothetical protein BJN34_12865 [Cupriavidus necator]